MLEKPDLQDNLILDCVRGEFEIPAARLTFLPLGYDVNTAVYRLETAEGAAYFLKLRKGAFDEISVVLPQFLKAQGVRGMIAPLATRAGRLWGEMGEYKLILYPYIEGQNGYRLALTHEQWLDFGAAMGGVHRAQTPPELARQIRRETYSPRWRGMVKAFQAQVEQDRFDEPAAAKLAAFMHDRREQISQVVARAESLCQALQQRPPELVLCHSDIHPGNLLLAADGGLYIVDWDTPIFAPKERDLALVGGCPAWCEPQQAAGFYQGYGEAEVDRTALAYYRYERIVMDMAEFGKALLLSDEGGEDREQSYEYFASNFLPNHEIELARKSDPVGQ